MSLFSSFISPADPFLSKIDKWLVEVSTGPKPQYFFAFLFTVYCIERFCQHQSPFEKSHTLLDTSLVNLVSIQLSLRSTETSFLSFSVSVSLPFSLFAWGFYKVLAFHHSFHVFSYHVACYFSLITRMRTCKKITSPKRVISSGAFIWGERRDSLPRNISASWYIAFSRWFIE